MSGWGDVSGYGGGWGGPKQQAVTNNPWSEQAAPLPAPTGPASSGQAQWQPYSQPQPQPQAGPQGSGGPPAPPNASQQQFNQNLQQFNQNSDWKDNQNYSPDQWAAWQQQEQQLRAQGKGAQNCPPNLPFTGRGGQCAAKPDDCPDGMHIEGNDQQGTARCVQNGAPPGAGGGQGGASGGQGGVAMPQWMQAQGNLLPGTYAPQLGYYGSLGSMGGTQGGLNPQMLGSLIQSLLQMQGP